MTFKNLTSAESRCWRTRRERPSSTQALYLGFLVSISERIPWWYFINSSTEETSLSRREGTNHIISHLLTQSIPVLPLVMYVCFILTSHRGFSCVSICWIMLSIQASRSLTVVKKRNLSAVSSRWDRRPSQASSRVFQASTTSRSVVWMAVACSPAYWARSRVAVSWNCWTYRTRRV